MLSEYYNDPIEDPLTFNELHFDIEEWSNIPPLVPKYLLHLNNHVKALVKHCKEKSTEETTENLRRDVFKHIEVSFFKRNIHNEYIVKRSHIRRACHSKRGEASVTEGRPR